MDEAHKRKCFMYKWRIENFNFCWHKTGELLESPLFHIESTPRSFWKLWLYPRGEDDGEYISYYLFRAEGSPEVVDIDFELSVSVGELLVKPPVSFEKMYSFQICQKKGEKSFVKRREIFSISAGRKESVTLTLRCRIFNREGTDQFGRTTIAMERITGVNVFDDEADLEYEKNQDIEVNALLNPDPLISINLSCFEDNIVIKIHPKSCEKIRYAICKITVIKNWERESPIEHVRSWIGEIKTDIWRYSVSLPETESADQGVTACAQKIFFLHYDFAYSFGIENTKNELNDYGTDIWVENISLLEPMNEKVQPKMPRTCPTVVDALTTAYSSQLKTDTPIKIKNKVFMAHKSIIRARSSKFMEMLEESPDKISDYKEDIISKFLTFLYTDRVGDLCWLEAIHLYKMAADFEVELLKKKCRIILERKRDVKNASELVLLADTYKDLTLKANVQKYIVARDDEIFTTREWVMFAENHWELAEKCMLLKYKIF